MAGMSSRNGRSRRREVKRRNFLRIAGGVLVALRAAGDAGARRIELRARKFEFMPAEVRVARGRPVTFVVTSEDFVHGFNLPDFGVRRDLVPGMAVEVTITPAKSGRFHYLCDNFCGDGHDRMSGILVVAD